MRHGRFVRTWNVCCGARAIAAKTRTMNSVVTSAWNKSDIEFTNTRQGFLRASGSSSLSQCSVTPNPGPLVRGFPSL